MASPPCWSLPEPGSAEAPLAGRCREAPVDDERVPRDPAGLVAGEVDRAPGHVPGAALHTERIGAPPPLAGVRAETLHHRRPHGAGRDRVDPDAPGPELDGDAGDEADDARLGRGVGGAAVAAHAGD